MGDGLSRGPLDGYKKKLARTKEELDRAMNAQLLVRADEAGKPRHEMYGIIFKSSV